VSFGFYKNGKHFAIKGGNVVRLAAAHPISVLHDFLIHIGGSGIVRISVLNLRIIWYGSACYTVRNFSLDGLKQVERHPEKCS
jgi:hypothetical protein